MSSVREQLAAKRVEAQGRAAVGGMEDRTVSSQVKRSGKSGKLDISSLKLDRIPAEVYSYLLGIRPQDLSKPPGANDPVPASSSQEVEELVSLKAGSNSIRELDVEFGAFGALKTIDLSRNQLESLPNSFADLLRLTFIDLSHNSLSSLSPTLLLLPALQTLDLSHNLITDIDLSGPVEPSEEGLSYGAGFLSTSISRTDKPRYVWPALRTLNLAYNRLQNEAVSGFKSIPPSYSSPSGLALIKLDLSGNKLSGTLDVEASLGGKTLSRLEQLVLDNNASLMSLSGDLGSQVKVSMEGCGIVTNSSGSTQDGAASTAATGSRRPTAAANSGSKLPVPSPDLPMVYRACPAATFDSEPLNIDMDVYLPPSPAGPSGHPVVVWFHGGGLLQGNKENLPPHFRRLPSYPFPSGSSKEHVIVISPNYRLAPQTPILDILSDVDELLSFIRTKMNDKLKSQGHSEHMADPGRICLSGGSAGGYLALIAGLKVPPRARDEEVGGYRGEKTGGGGIKCLAPFYPITDLTDEFWANKTDPVPWYGESVPHEPMKPFVDPKAPPVFTSDSKGPRAKMYMYMLQHALFPSLLFMRQRAVGQSLDAFRPSPLSLSVPHRMDLCTESGGVKHPPVYFVYGTEDDKVQRMDRTLVAMRAAMGEDFTEERLEGLDHQFDEDPNVECEAFRDWLGKTLI